MSSKNPDRTIAIGENLLSRLGACDLCPNECRINRLYGETGQCGCDSRLKIASSDLHFGEEPPLSGNRGSGTIFLSGCSLSCLYCQNYNISQNLIGQYYRIEELAEIMLNLQKRGAHNINFVTPDHFFGHIAKAIGLALKNGLTIPTICNCSGWQKPDILEMLNGVFDIYLVDMRYGDDEIGRNCSDAPKYKEVNRKAVREMHRQVGDLATDKYGIAARGLMVRHLVLPGCLAGSEAVFEFLAEEISVYTYVNVMSQYYPAYRAAEYPPLDRRISSVEFDLAKKMFYNSGLKNGHIQEII